MAVGPEGLGGIRHPDPRTLRADSSIAGPFVHTSAASRRYRLRRPLQATLYNCSQSCFVRTLLDANHAVFKVEMRNDSPDVKLLET